MTRKICPLFTEPFYSYSIDLSDTTYTLQFRWSSRAQQWFMTIEDSEENVLIRNVALVPYYPLLKQYALQSILGDFLLVPFERSGIENSSITTPREIYKTHYLVYSDDAVTS